MRKLLVLPLLLGAAVVGDTPSPDRPGLENAPITHVGREPLTSITATLLPYDTLRIVVEWKHPSDSLGVEDSTFFRIKASKTIRFMGGGTAGVNAWKRRKWSSATTADTFKVLRPVPGDSVIFTADSISQCRVGSCSVPGSAAWGYRRRNAPPAMTFDRILIDSIL